MEFKLISKIKAILMIPIVGIILSSCASIVSKSNYPVYVTSEPRKASVKIVNSEGREVFNGKTPAGLTLGASKKYFKKETYTVTFSLDGYEPVTTTINTKVDGWYWGNLVFGGLIGFLIVDPATGSMYKIKEPNVSVKLQSNQSEASLKILQLNDLSNDDRKNLIKLN